MFNELAKLGIFAILSGFQGWACISLINKNVKVNKGPFSTLRNYIPLERGLDFASCEIWKFRLKRSTIFRGRLLFWLANYPCFKSLNWCCSLRVSITGNRAPKFDIGLHKANVIYRESSISCFRMGILNSHIGLLPKYRGRCVMEWSLLNDDPTGLSVYFIDSGIAPSWNRAAKSYLLPDFSACCSIDLPALEVL